MWTPLADAAVLNPLSGSRLSGEVTVDTARMEVYVTMVLQHADSMQKLSLARNVQNAASNASLLINELLSKTADRSCNRVEVRTSIASVLSAYISNVSKVLKHFEDRHVEFVVWSNRRALEYMLKWLAVFNEEAASIAATNAVAAAKEERRNAKKAVKKVNSLLDSKPAAAAVVQQGGDGVLQSADTQKNSKAAGLIEKYFNYFAQVAAAADQALMEAETEALKMFVGGRYVTILSEDELVIERVQEQVEGLERHFMSVRARVVRIYSPAGYGLMDVLLNTPFALIYVVKAFRIFLLWVSLVFARALFQTRYNDAVYLQNRAPPHPAWFVLIFLGFDVALNAGVVMLLTALMYLLRTRLNNFPVTSYVIRAVLTDYAVSTALMAVLAFVMATVIRRKKYFRYRFEGDRGIRALSDMILWTSAVILIIPYFRFFDA